MEMQSPLNGNSRVDFDKIGVRYMLQSVVAETALVALSSRLLFLFKTSPLLDVNMLADLTATDNGFPLGELNRLEKPTAENMDAGNAEDTESEDEEEDDEDDDDDEEGSEDEDEDDYDSDSESFSDGESGDDSDDDDSDEDDDENDSDEDDDEDEEDEESDEEEDKEMHAQPPSKRKQ